MASNETTTKGEKGKYILEHLAWEHGNGRGSQYCSLHVDKMSDFRPAAHTPSIANILALNDYILVK